MLTKLRLRYGEPGEEVNCSEGRFIIDEDRCIDVGDPAKAKFLLANIPKMFEAADKNDLTTEVFSTKKLPEPKPKKRKGLAASAAKKPAPKEETEDEKRYRLEDAERSRIDKLDVSDDEKRRLWGEFIGVPVESEEEEGEEEEGEEEEGEAGDEPESLGDFNAKDAIEYVGTVDDEETLRTWLGNDDRKTVKGAVRERLDALKAE